MTRSNRIANRLILLLIGFVALGVAAALALPYVPKSVLAYRLPELSLTATGDWIVAVVALVIVVLSVAWIVTRGRGRTRTAIDGELSMDARVVDDLLTDALSDEPDVVAVSAAAYRVRGRTVLRVRVDARRGADLRRLTDAVHRSIDQLDEAIGADQEQRLPVFTHITSGLRASLSREHRVA